MKGEELCINQDDQQHSHFLKLWKCSVYTDTHTHTQIHTHIFIFSTQTPSEPPATAWHLCSLGPITLAAASPRRTQNWEESHTTHSQRWKKVVHNTPTLTMHIVPVTMALIILPDSSRCACCRRSPALTWTCIQMLGIKTAPDIATYTQKTSRPLSCLSFWHLCSFTQGLRISKGGWRGGRGGTRQQSLLKFPLLYFVRES